ncbi:MAG TPA: hypothetical protein PKY96_14340 [Flavobacteriales bacterium]|nr:hypothetical protein [Flavobacteriales bacterium]
MKHTAALPPRMIAIALWSVFWLSPARSFAQNQSLVTHHFAGTNKDDPTKNTRTDDVTHFVIHLDDPYSMYIVSSMYEEDLTDPMKNIRFTVQREVDSEFDEKTRIVSRTYLTSMMTGSVPLSDFVYVTVSKTLDNKVLRIFIVWDKVTWSYW